MAPRRSALRHGRAGADVFVELRVCRFHVRRDPERADAEAQRADDDPAEEAQVKHKLFPLVAVHHLTACGDAGVPAVVGMIKLDIVCHRIGIRLDNAGDDDEPDFEEITLEAKNTSGAVLGEVINHNVQTLADTIAPPRDVASELRRSEHVTDLRRAIGINDKFLMIRDLFGGDAAAYEAAIGTLNGFDDFDECMIYIAENYAWNANSDGAKFLMELLERKFA